LNFKPNFVPISRGADVNGVAKPVRPEAYGVLPGLRRGAPQSARSQTASLSALISGAVTLRTRDASGALP
jgi:hypothetical protein